MAVILSKSGVPSVTFSTATTYPNAVGGRFIPNQFIGLSDDDTPKVASLGSARQLIPLEFENLERQDRTNLLAFMTNPSINWAKNSFTLTDELGISYLVRFLEPEFNMPEESDDNVSLSMIFTVTKV
jgi:hypothetical protein